MRKLRKPLDAWRTNEAVAASIVADRKFRPLPAAFAQTGDTRIKTGFYYNFAVFIIRIEIALLMASKGIFQISHAILDPAQYIGWNPELKSYVFAPS